MKIPFYTNRHSIASIGDLKTVYDHLNQIANIVPEGYKIEIREHKKSITLACYQI